MRSVIARPLSRRSTFTSCTRSSRLRLEHQLVVERRLERDRDAGVARDRPAFAADVLDQHLLGLEHVPVDLEPAAVELLELAARELLAHRAEPRTELRPEHRQVRLHAQLRRLDLSEDDLLDAKLVGDLVRVRRGKRSAFGDEPPQRLAELELRGGARLPAELDHAPNVGDLGEQRVESGSAASGHGARCTDSGPARRGSATGGR